MTFANSVLSAGSISFIFNEFLGGSVSFGAMRIVDDGHLHLASVTIDGGHLDFGPPIWLPIEVHGGSIDLSATEVKSGSLTLALICTDGSARFEGIAVGGKGHVQLDEFDVSGGSVRVTDISAPPGLVYGSLAAGPHLEVERLNLRRKNSASESLPRVLLSKILKTAKH